jgi:hypothetical protein
MSVLDYLPYAGSFVAGAVSVFAFLAPKTKTKVDDRVLAVLKKYGVPLAEFLETQSRKAPVVVPRERVRDNRTH